MAAVTITENYVSDFDVQEFLKKLSRETWAIVYAYNPPANSRDLWYDRWRYDVINDYVKAVALLGAEPLVIDVDRFVSMPRSEADGIDYVVNLNSGATPIPNIGVVQSVASWLQIPSFPNTADAVVVGERKDVCKSFFREWFHVPPAVQKPTDRIITTRTIMKPKTLGNSRGIVVLEPGDKLSASFSTEVHILEEFVSGYEVSIPVCFDPQVRDYVVMPPVIYLPTVERPEEWYLSEDEKTSNRINYERVFGETSDELRQALKDASRKFQFGDLGRFDFRWVTEDPMKPQIESHELAFIEINCLPTLNENVNFLCSVSEYLTSDNSLVSSHAKGLAEGDLAALVYLLLNARLRHVMTK